MLSHFSGVLSGPDKWYLCDRLICLKSIRSGRMQFMFAPESMITSIGSFFNLAIMYNAFALYKHLTFFWVVGLICVTESKG